MRTTAGFMLIEILLAVLLIGTMVSMVLPRFKNRATEVSLITYTNQLNRLIQWTRQQAIADRTTYRITFFKKKPTEPDLVRVEFSSPDPEKKNQLIWQQLKHHAFETEQKMPDFIRFVAAFRNNQELFEDNKNVAYCYIMHEGLAQDLMLHITKKKENREEEKATLIIEPFLGSFKLHEGHIPLKKRGTSYA